MYFTSACPCCSFIWSICGFGKLIFLITLRKVQKKVWSYLVYINKHKYWTRCVIIQNKVYLPLCMIKIIQTLPTPCEVYNDKLACDTLSEYAPMQ